MRVVPDEGGSRSGLAPVRPVTTGRSIMADPRDTNERLGVRLLDWLDVAILVPPRKSRGLITMRWAVGFALLMALVFALTYGYQLGGAYIDQVIAR